MSHDSGHLLETILGWKTNPHFGPFHIVSSILIGAGFWLLASAWKVLYMRHSAVTGWQLPGLTHVCDIPNTSASF